MSRKFIRKNLTSISILLFLLAFVGVQYVKPAFLYDNKGAIRQFGIGKKNKTVLPIWFLTIILAILSYFIVLYYLAIPKLL
jgi:hypothetical protein